MALAEAQQILACLAIIAAVVGPVWIGYCVVARRKNRSIWPSQPTGATTWTGFDVVCIWFAMIVLQLMSAAAEPLSIVFASVGIAIFGCWKKYSKAEANAEPRTVIADLMFGVPVWLLFAPLTFIVYLATLLILEAIGGPVEQHPLARASTQNISAIILFVCKACLVAPILEELAFRRVLIPWAMGERYRSWCVVAVAGFFAVIRVDGPDPRLGPLWFYFALVLGAVVIHFFATAKQFAIYASAMFFAMIHVHVWPSPIPLFVLGLGLGFAVASTRSVLPAIVVHGLFNLISTLWVLSRAAD